VHERSCHHTVSQRAETEQNCCRYICFDTKIAAKGVGSP
jgi:hypothetical protein